MRFQFVVNSLFYFFPLSLSLSLPLAVSYPGAQTFSPWPCLAVATSLTLTSQVCCTAVGGCAGCTWRTAHAWRMPRYRLWLPMAHVWRRSAWTSVATWAVLGSSFCRRAGRSWSSARSGAPQWFQTPGRRTGHMSAKHCRRSCCLSETLGQENPNNCSQDPSWCQRREEVALRRTVLGTKCSINRDQITGLLFTFSMEPHMGDKFNLYFLMRACLCMCVSAFYHWYTHAFLHCVVLLCIFVLVVFYDCLIFHVLFEKMLDHVL